MDRAVILLGFGEPMSADRETVVEYLANIFHANMDLEDDVGEDQAKNRAYELAERRAPDLIDEYREMGNGSPLIPQMNQRAESLGNELDERGITAECMVGMQFTEPYIHEVVENAVESGVDEIIALPQYPLCGETTTVDALRSFNDALRTGVSSIEISGWHRHPRYPEMRARNIQGFTESQGLSLGEEAELIFSAHGTPMKYIERGSLYVDYVEEHCADIASMLGIDKYSIGYQNHSNRGVPWTQPDIDDLVRNLDSDRVVVEPVSFIHEQSETLSELDIELREICREQGLEMHRVPVPHDKQALVDIQADLVEAGIGHGSVELNRCRCVEGGALCTNNPG